MVETSKGIILSNDKQIKATLKLETDKATVDNTKHIISSVQQALTKLGTNNAFTELEKDAKKLIKTEEALEAQTKKTNAASSGGMSGRGAVGGGMSGRGAVGGGTSGRGAIGDAGRAIGSGIGGDAGQLVSAFSALNPAMLAGTVAAVGLGVALKGLKAAEDEALEAALRVLELKKDELELLKLSTDELLVIQETRQQEIEDLRILAETAQGLADAAAAAEPRMAGAANSFGEFTQNLGSNLFQIGDAVGIVGSDTDALKDKADELSSQLVTAEGELANVADALNSDEVAANDAAKALADLAQEMESDLYSAASDAGEAIREETAALGRSKEANLDRIVAINSEQRAIQAEIMLLETQAVQSDKTKEKISQLNDKLSDLEREAGTVADVAGTQVSEAFKKAGEAAQKASEEAAQSAIKAAEDARKAAADAKKERQKAAADELKTIIDFANKRAEVEFDAMVQRETIAIDANREQERLLRESKQAFNQDFFQDFLGEFQRKQELAYSLQQTQISAQQSFEDVNRSVGNQLTNLDAQQKSSAVTNNTVNNFNFTGIEKQQVLQLLQQAGLGA